MARRMGQRHEHLPCLAAVLTDVVLDDGVPAVKAVLVPEPLEDALGRVGLLPGDAVIIIQNMVNDAGAGLKLGLPGRGLAPVTRRHRIGQHLSYRIPVQPEGPRRLSRWEEIDWQELSWTIPPSRMKADREHRVPLSRRAVEVLQAAKEISGGTELIFPSPRGNKPLSDMTLLRLLQRSEIPCVVHGFRSSFVTWFLETEDEMREVRKTALAHDPDDDETEMAYIAPCFMRSESR